MCQTGIMEIVIAIVLVVLACTSILLWMANWNGDPSSQSTPLGKSLKWCVVLMLAFTFHLYWRFHCLDAGFKDISTGMTKSDVIYCIGLPGSTSPVYGSERESWQYKFFGTWTIEFDKNEKVVTKLPPALAP